ncbi:MAG: hypothetical protein DMF90_27830 [Acidobacteria bacterium]|nr:MAG: hypothetical protein DMF90_27830 [Acidobacteriota bacterium]
MAPVQHYVPQFLLRNFCAGAKPKIWAFDKNTGKSFETNVRNIAGEREFYDLSVGDATLSLEEGLSKLETQAGTVIDRIIGARSLGVLSDDDRGLLAVFVSTQMQRSPNPRQSMLAMNQELRRVLKGRFGIEDGDFPELTAEEAKAMTMKSLTEPQKFAEHILNKAWLMFETSSAHPFFIGDSPVTLQNNTQPKGPLRGNLGLAVRGIEIYLPISSTLTLAFFCRSHEEMIRDGVERMRTTMVRDPGHPMGFGDLLNWRRVFRTGVAMPSSPDNVLNHNSLQVRHAERYVFSSQPDCELVESMIADDARFRVGPRPEIA